nr:hypothetical protein GCM10025732_43160 [Glycomyces mayteni]
MVGEALGDLVAVPDLGELRRPLPQGRHELSGAGLGPHGAVGDPQGRDEGAALAVAVVGGVLLAFGRAGEPAVRVVAVEPGERGAVAEQGLREVVLDEGLAEVREDQRGCVLEPVEDAQERGGDVRAVADAGGEAVPGRAEQVVALLVGQAQGAGEEASIWTLGCGPRRCSSRV